MYAIFLLYMKKPCATSTPCFPQGAHRPVYSMLRRRLMSLVAHTDLQISLRICTDLELRSSFPAHNLTFMLKYINVYEEKNAEET